MDTSELIMSRANYDPPLFPLIFWAILTTLAVTPIAIKAAIRFQVIDEPNS